MRCIERIVKMKQTQSARLMSRSVNSLEPIQPRQPQSLRSPGADRLQSNNFNGSMSIVSAEKSMSSANLNPQQVNSFAAKALTLYNAGNYSEALAVCEKIYDFDAHRTENLLLMGAIHFQLRNYSESVFYNQQCIRVDPNFAEAFSNLGNALKELGDLKGATQFYLKAIKLKPRFGDAYNNLASAYMLQGRVQQAMETYQMALVLNPNLVDAHTNLGNLYKATGDLEASKQCYLEAIRIKPDFPISWNNLAGVFKEEGQLSTAVAYYREALRLCPEFADAHSNLGNALKEQNLIQDAIACYQSAIKLRPDFAIAHGNLGSCYYDLGDFASAIKSFNYAIQLEPNFPDAYNNLGNALKEEARLDDAINAYRAALHLKPDHPHAYNNLGNAMIEKGFIKEAIHCYVTAIRLMPKFAAAHSNLGSVFKDQGKFEQAIAHYLEAINIDSSFADAYSNLGNVYKELDEIDRAVACYNTAISLEPNYADAYANLAAAMKDQGKLYEAIDLYRQALKIRPEYGDALANLIHCYVSLCDWSNRREDHETLQHLITVQLATKNTLPCVQPLHSFLYSFSLSECLQIAKKFAQKVKTSVALTELNFKYRMKPKTMRLRIGFVSSDFNNHPFAHLTQSIYGLFDRNKFEIFCYSLTRSDGSRERQQIESETEHFFDCSGQHVSEIASRINHDAIHILMNCNGYTHGSRNELFALRPAPLQISFLGFIGSLGAEFIQYLIADPIVVPMALRSFYQEKMMYLPHSFVVNDHRQSAAHCVTPEALKAINRAQYGLSEDKFVFCCFNQLFKVDPTVFDCWMRILKRVPNSVLWLLRFPKESEANLLKEARQRGIREDRLVFTDVAPKEEHITRGFLADLCLDTPLVSGLSTAVDILWSGTPMITLLGEKMCARVGASVLTAAGLSELVCKTLEGESSRVESA